MRKKLLTLVFTLALLVGSTVPLLGGGTALAGKPDPEQKTRVTICHKGKPITVSVNALAMHIEEHGDEESENGCPQEV